MVVDAAGEIFGDAPLSPRVQALAEPGTVLITARVQRHQPACSSPKIAACMPAEGRARADGAHASCAPAGTGASAPPALSTPLVGREEELDLLRRRWERAARGEGQLTLIVGEPGIGRVATRRGVSREARRDAAHLGRGSLHRRNCCRIPAIAHPVAGWGRASSSAKPKTPASQRLADLENTRFG